MIVLDQRFDLVIDSGAIKAHHEKLANLPDIMVSIKEGMEIEVGELWADLLKSFRNREGRSTTAMALLAWFWGHYSSTRH